MKNMKKFKDFINENKEDGYSEEFDENWEEVESLVDDILMITDEYSEEELKLMSIDDLTYILREELDKLYP